MVMQKLSKRADQSESSTQSPRYIVRRWLSTQVAARRAAGISRWFASGRSGDQAPDEHTLFAAMHACAYRAVRASKPRRTLRLQRSQWLCRWKVIRDGIIDLNLGLVYSVLDRFGRRDVDWEDQRSEGLLALMRAVDGFDPWRGVRFSTYAWHSILRSLIQLERQTKRYRLLFPVQHEASFERADGLEVRSDVDADRVTRVLRDNLGELTSRESVILGWRFPMDGSPGMTLGEVGAVIGLSKERVRQIQNSALTKLRQVLEADPILQ